MQTIELKGREINSPKDIYNLFKSNKLNKGDQIKVLLDDNSVLTALVVLIIIGIIIYMEEKQNQKKSFGTKVLNDLFSGVKSSEEIEKEIELKYGININKEVDNNFRKDWFELATHGLERAYSDNEPDYSNVKIKEPNPLYKKK